MVLIQGVLPCNLSLSFVDGNSVGTELGELLVTVGVDEVTGTVVDDGELCELVVVVVGVVEVAGTVVGKVKNGPSVIE